MATEYRLRNRTTDHELTLFTHSNDALEEVMRRGGHNADKFELVSQKEIEMKRDAEHGTS